MIPFNKPYFTGKEYHYINEAINSGKISGNGLFTKKCHEFLQSKYGFQKVLLTSSCTDALEMAALLLDISPGDEVIMPSYTFVSTANAFILRGAKIVFADSNAHNPNIDTAKLEELITSSTKAIVVVHYAGISCDMDKIINLSEKYNLYVIEDAAQAIGSSYKGRPLGSIGHLAAFSFHETKNIISGEGGMLVINDPKFNQRAEIIWEKGTNRAEFQRGEVNKYGWVDVGSSFLPSEITAAILFAQLEHIENIQLKRLHIWQRYNELLKPLSDKGFFRLPHIPEFATNNGHMFYLLLNNEAERNNLILDLKKSVIHAVFHYLSLHKSPYYINKHDGRQLKFSDYYSDCLLRLPLFYELTDEEVNYVTEKINYYLEDTSSYQRKIN
jgi:dTDP-4-amino-4,6-dideoxygalactose transaminase